MDRETLGRFNAGINQYVPNDFCLDLSMTIPLVPAVLSVSTQTTQKAHR